MFEHAIDFLFGDGAAVGRVIAGGASVIGEAASYILRASPEIIDFIAWQKFSGDSTTNWEKWKSTEKHGEFSGQIKIMKSHVLLLEQLERHAGGSEILEEYKKLGHSLPDEMVLGKVKRVLSKTLSPRKHGDDDTLIKQVNEALEVLKDGQHAGMRDSYNDMLKKAESDTALQERVKKFFNDFKGKQTEFYEAAEREVQKSRLLLEGEISKPGKAEKIFESFKKAGTAKQGAIVFAAVTGTALVAYGVSRAWEKNKKRAASFTESLENDKSQTAMTL